MNSKIIFLFCLLLTFFNLQSWGQESSMNGKVARIVIDAGHGGEDPGALGKRVNEKDVNLAVALKFGKLISQNYNDVEVIYTRQKDQSVDLYKRARIANEKKADLFVSIHCNSAKNRAAQGVETFVMGLHKSEASLAVARQENAAILKEKNYETNYEGFNPNSPEANVIFSLYSSTYLKNSILLAAAVQKNLVNNTHFTDRQVQQAGFWVLYKVAMPSILVELGFISNYDEESILMDEKAQNTMAACLYNAFVDYKNNIEGTDKKGIEIQPIKNQTILREVAQKAEEAAKEKEKAEAEKKEQPSLAVSLPDSIQIRFRVQIYASPDDLPFTDAKFQNADNLKKYQENGWWKYTSGDAKTFDEVKALQNNLKKNGFPDAFIVAFKNEVKISLDEARKLTSNH